MKKSKKPAVIESMYFLEYSPPVPYNYANYTIRIWRNEKELKDKYKENEEIIKVLQEKKPKTVRGISKILLSIERINAFEILNSMNKDGVVVYKDWP